MSAQAPPHWDLAALTASDGGDFHQLGWTVDVEGDVAVVGSRFDDSPGFDTGSAYVFERGPGGWKQVQKLLPADVQPGDQFGWAVAIHGSRIAVSARLGDTVTPQVPNTGAVYVFVRSGALWTQEARLTPTGGDPNDEFGRAIALEDDGLAVGAIGDDDAFPLDPSNNAGAVYVFSRAGTLWTERQKLLAQGALAGDFLGTSLAMTPDGIAAGAPGRDAQVSDAGAVFAFARTGTTWSQEAELWAPAGASGDSFGGAVGISGQRIVVGAPSAQVSGRAYVFERSGGSWGFTAELSGSGVYPGHQVGASVAIDGDRIVAGAPAAAAPQITPGAAHVFVYSEGAWSEVWRLVASNGSSGDRLGAAVALDCGTTVVGAPLFDGGGLLVGSAYVFDALEPPVQHCVPKLNSLGCKALISTSGSPSPIDPAPFLIEASNVLSEKTGLLLYGQNGSVVVPFSGGTLCVMPPIGRGPLVFSGGNLPTDCSGRLRFDFKAWLLSGADPDLTPGLTVDAQWWYRDPGDADLVGLSDAVTFPTCP